MITAISTEATIPVKEVTDMSYDVEPASGLVKFNEPTTPKLVIDWDTVYRRLNMGILPLTTVDGPITLDERGLL